MWPYSKHTRKLAKITANWKCEEKKISAHSVFLFVCFVLFCFCLFVVFCFVLFCFSFFFSFFLFVCLFVYFFFFFFCTGLILIGPVLCLALCLVEPGFARTSHKKKKKKRKERRRRRRKKKEEEKKTDTKNLRKIAKCFSKKIISILV